jgi:hypothetical protein
MELGATHQLLVFDDVNLLGKTMYIIKTEALLNASVEIGIEVNTEKTM